MKSDVKESIFYVQALMNHWLLEEIVKSKASFFRGGYYSHGKQFVAELPIYRIDFDNSSEKKLHDEIVEKVNLMMDLSSRKTSATNQREKDIISRAIENIQDEINTIVDNLYGVEQQKGVDIDEF